MTAKFSFIIFISMLLDWVIAVQIITNCTGLQNMQNNLNGDYLLANDIDCSATSAWNAGAGFMPIGGFLNWFTGSLNGGNHTISNLTIHRPSSSYVGLFGSMGGINATIMQITLKGVNIKGVAYVGGLVGCNCGLGLFGFSTGGRIINGYVTGVISANPGSQYVGGLVGYNYYGTIINSYVTGVVSANPGSQYVGGLVGYSAGTITNSYAMGVVSANAGGQYVGGLVGYSNDDTITNCYATSNITGSNDVGGLVGYLNDVSLTNSYATGNVTASTYAGGLVGYSYQGAITNSYAIGIISGSTCVGGLLGFSDFSLTFITQCYATGSVSGSSAVGGLVGCGGKITLSYASGDVSGSNSVGGLVGSGEHIIQCYATGNVNGSTYVGGLAGYSGDVIRSYATGNVSGSSYVGGLVGYYYNYLTLVQSYATGNVNGSNNVGGLAGLCYGVISNTYATGSVSGSYNVGGLVGDNENTITNSYAIGRVTGSSNVGGLIGRGIGGAYSSYWNTQTTKQTTSIGGLGKNSVALNHNATYVNWDFDCIWSIYEGNDAPKLTLNNCPASPGVQQQVSNCDELQAAMFLYTSDIRLTQDIDCTVSATWNNGTGFYPGRLSAGSFDGSGYRIMNLMINRASSSRIGLFGETNTGAQIRNVILQLSVIVGNTSVGNLVGYNGCSITNSYAIGNVTGSGNYAGGLVGYNSGTITNSYAAGSVSGLLYVGGLVGYKYNSIITQSYSMSTTSGLTYVGGFVGYSYSSSGAINQCYAAGDVSGLINVGGFIGYNYHDTITQCYASGNVLGSSDVGGLMGYNNAGSISQCYATGNISGFTSVGGLVGAATSDTAIFVYWDIQTSAQTYSARGIGLITTAMQQPASFVGWDFVSTWIINPGRTYPLLQAFIIPPVLSYPLSNVTNYIGVAFVFTIPANTFSDPNGLSLSYSAELVSGSSLPSWLLFKASTQTFSGTPPSGAQGTLLIMVSTYNLPSYSISGILSLTIPNRPPTLNAPFTQKIALNGQSFQFTVPDTTFFDPDNDHLQLSAALPNSTSLPPWLNFNTALGIFSGTATQRGAQWVNVTASDGFGGQVSALLEIVTPNAAPQTTATFPNQALIVDQAANFTLPASIFIDVDNDPLTYSASLLGGGELPPWLSFNAQTLTFQGTPNAVSFLVLSVIATDTYNATATLNFGVSISALSTNAPPSLAIQMLDQTVTVGQFFTLVLPKNMFVDPNGDPLIYSATLEGGAPLPSWLNFSATSLVFSGLPPIVSSFPITVRADDGQGRFALDSFTLIITNNQNLPPLLQNPLSNQAVSVGENYQFTIPSNTFIDLNNAPLTYTANSSPNGPLPSWLDFDSKTRTFSGTPSNTDTNIYSARTTTIEVRASNGIGSVVDTFQLSVTGTSQAAQIINALITLVSIGSTAFAIYRNRAWLWNTLCKKKYEKETKEISLNAMFTYQFGVASKQIRRLKIFNKALLSPSHKKSCSRSAKFSSNPYQELADGHRLPDWLHFNRDTMTLSGTANEPADLYICAEGFDGRYLEAFKLRCGLSQGKDLEMQNI